MLMGPARGTAQGKGDNENSLVVAALRSAFKELGMLPTSIEVLGTMRRAQDATGSTEITPILAYLGHLKDISDLTPGRSHAEVRAS
jgi:hypothetical protein